MTAEDIRNGEPLVSYACPVALAVKRASGCSGVSVDGLSIAIAMSNGDQFEVYAPQFVNDFVDDFDTNHSVEPFEFDLDIPEVA